MKCVIEMIGGDFPTGGDSRGGMALTIETEQPLENSIDDSSLGLTRDEGRIQRLGLSSIDEDQICSGMSFRASET